MPTTAWAWLVAGLFSSAIGLGQYFGAGAGFLPFINQTELGEAFANLRQRNQFASLTSMALATLLWFSARMRPDSGPGERLNGRSNSPLHSHLTERRQSMLLLLAAGLLAVGNAASSSRTGLVQLAFLCALFWLWDGWRQPAARRILLTAVAAYALAMLVLPWLAGLDPSAHGMYARLRAGDPACGGRLTLWSNVLHLIALKPWFGWGWGELDYAHYVTLYPGERFCDILGNAHNLPLHLAVELGVPLAVGVCGLLSWLVWRARPWGETDPLRQLAWAVLALIGLHSLLEYPLWYGPFQMAFGLCVCMLWSTQERHDQKPCLAPGVETRRAHVNYFLAATAALIMTVAAYAAWDYHRVSQIYLDPAQRDASYRDNTLEKIRDTHLFRRQFDFAVLSLTPLTPANAPQIYAMSRELLHYSPEPRVIEKVIESAVMLRHDDEALLHLARYRAAFPKNHAQWRQALTMPDRLAN